MRRAVERSCDMSVLHDSFPLSNHRTSLRRYLRGISFPRESVAGTIIRERLAEQYAGDPLRSALALWACEAAGGNLADALPVAAAFELFDRFLLLHAELSTESAPTIVRWGLGQSLNAGDAFYALAFRTLAGDVSNADRRLETAQLVAQAVLEAIEENDDLRRNCVLTAAALHAGAVIGGAPQSVARAFEEAGRLLNEEPKSAVAALRAHACGDSLEELEEVAQYVARHAA